MDRIPPPPYIANVPVPVAERLRARRHHASERPLLSYHRPATTPSPRRGRLPSARRLTAHDVPELCRLADGHVEPIPRSYRTVDLQVDRVWGIDLDGRLAGLARAHVTLRELWFVNGVFTLPGARNRGIGGAVTAAVARDAHNSGAEAALFVFEENEPARRAYERVGFVQVGRRTLLESEGLSDRPRPAPGGSSASPRSR